MTSLLDPSGVTDWTQPGTTIVGQLLAPLTTSTTICDRLAALATCIALIKRTGSDVETLRGWAAAQPDATIANQVIQAVRAGYPDNAEWLQVAQTRNDTLRQLQRDALVAYLAGARPIGGQMPVDVNSLFEYFLIDVEMCACGTTSRIVQAIASVQLFIQRILLDLEPGISATYIDPTQWEWNSEYRIWQANREIFLYPGELDRSRAARRQDAVVQRSAVSAVPGPAHRRQHRGSVPRPTSRSSRMSRACRCAR